MGAGASTETDLEAVKTEILSKLESVKESSPDNLCAKHLTKEYIEGLNQDDQTVLYRCTLTGLQNPTSKLGCYAMTTGDYEKFAPFFEKVIREYHGDDTGEKTHVSNWNFKIKTEGEAEPKSNDPKSEEDAKAEDKKESETEEVTIDLKDLGLEEVSMRIRVGRNLTGFNLPGMMTKAERIEFEKRLLTVFEGFISDENYKGKVHSLTPNFSPEAETPEQNPNLISEEEYNKLVEDHIMFKNMDNDPYLKSAGISSDWPFGRGCYVSEDKKLIVWFGEEDHLRVMCMYKGTDLKNVLEYLKSSLDKMETIEGVDFAKTEKFGYVTSCPSNLGTGMRASIHIKVPKLLKGGLEKVQELCDKMGLSVRGLGGEHTAVGEDGTVDISPKARLFITETDIVQKLYDGVKMLVEEEGKIQTEEVEASS